MSKQSTQKAAPELIERLKETAKEIRKTVVTMIHQAGDGHPGPALSSADIVTALYFHELRIDPKRPRWEDRDRFILSKGHACTVLYAALAMRGYFPMEELPGFRSAASMLQGHPVMNKTPGVDMTSGTLGHGLSVGAGMAAAAKLRRKDYRTYVILGDGELNEGIVWEGAQVAAHMKLDNLTVFVDHNGFQSGGAVGDVSGGDRIALRFEAFGWRIDEIDGHSMPEILRAIEDAKTAKGRPSLVLARTVKGKGVPFMENNNAWHKGVPDAAQLKQAVEALENQR